MITPLTSIVHNENNNYVSHNSNISDKVANHMPNGLMRVPEIQNGKNINNNLNNQQLKQLYTAKLAPSAGSLTENFVKAKSLSSPVYRYNEASTKYEAISMGPLMLKQLKKNLDMVI